MDEISRRVLKIGLSNSQDHSFDANFVNVGKNRLQADVEKEKERERKREREREKERKRKRVSAARRTRLDSAETT